MLSNKFFSWEAAMKIAKSYRLLGIDAHTKKHWWGYSVEVRAGVDAVNWWKQFWCVHRWVGGSRKMMSRSMNTCTKCGAYKAGPE